MGSCLQADGREADYMLMGKMTAGKTTDMWEADYMLMGKMTADGTKDMWEAYISTC